MIGRKIKFSYYPKKRMPGTGTIMTDYDMLQHHIDRKGRSFWHCEGIVVDAFTIDSGVDKGRNYYVKWLGEPHSYADMPLEKEMVKIEARQIVEIYKTTEDYDHEE